MRSAVALRKVTGVGLVADDAYIFASFFLHLFFRFFLYVNVVSIKSVIAPRGRGVFVVLVT